MTQSLLWDDDEPAGANRSQSLPVGEFIIRKAFWNVVDAYEWRYATGGTRRYKLGSFGPSYRQAVWNYDRGKAKRFPTREAAERFLNRLGELDFDFQREAVEIVARDPRELPTWATNYAYRQAKLF